MLRDILKQMIPFILLLGVLWGVAEILESTMTEGTILAPPVKSPTPSS